MGYLTKVGLKTLKPSKKNSKYSPMLPEWQQAFENYKNRIKTEPLNEQMLYDNNNFDYELAEELYDNERTECEEEASSHNKRQIKPLDRLTKNNHKKTLYQSPENPAVAFHLALLKLGRSMYITGNLLYETIWK
ncbi:hypothetical protein ROZALSC1DRAFT_25803, partial [Rozella allomycis CSF55]